MITTKAHHEFAFDPQLSPEILVDPRRIEQLRDGAIGQEMYLSWLRPLVDDIAHEALRDARDGSRLAVEKPLELLGGADQGLTADFAQDHADGRPDIADVHNEGAMPQARDGIGGHRHR